MKKAGVFIGLLIVFLLSTGFLQTGVFRSLVDLATGANIDIDYAHHEVHGGRHYYIEGYAELDDGDSLMIKLVTPDSTRWSHFRWGISSSGITIAELWEGASGQMEGGAAVTPINNNRNSSNVSGITITSGVTVASTLGTKISSAKWGSNDKFTGGGGAHGREDEIILKQDETYQRIFVSETDANIIQFKASWYEHINKK